MTTTWTRAPKQIGDFGEGLVTYALIRKGLEVAYVDHIGADLIAAGHDQRFAVSVKTRLFRPGSRESLCTIIDTDHLRKLQFFADTFALRPLLAQVVCLADQEKVHLFVFPTDCIEQILPRVQNGYSLRFGPRHLERLMHHPQVEYTLWEEGLVRQALPEAWGQQ